MEVESKRISKHALDAAVSILGSKSRALGTLNPNADPSTLSELSEKSTDVKIKALLLQFESHIEIVAAQANELKCDEYNKQAFGEIVATLICMRDIYELFPNYENSV